jgi:hypothetical protein
MEAIELEKALQQLDTLAQDEYHESLQKVITAPGDSDERRLLRIGRLLGVILKEPFAVSETRNTPSSITRAYRSWSLEPRETFEATEAQSCWQYRALEALRSDPNVIQSIGGELPSVYELARMAQGERGFWWYLATSCRKYLCRDAELRSQIERELQTAKRTGVDLKYVTPETIVASGGLAIGAALVQSIPALGMMGAPVIAGIIFVIYNIGIDAFCKWVSDHQFYHPDFPNADEEKRE